VICPHGRVGLMTGRMLFVADNVEDLLGGLQSASVDVPMIQYCDTASDQCCQYSSSVADCSSTDNKLKGCQSLRQCVPAVDVCWKATNQSSCEDIGSFCR
jgi:hypothetical protein